MPKKARPLTLNDNKIETICTAVARGNTFSNASVLAGISRNTFYVWEKRGRDIRDGISRSQLSKVDKALYVKFVESLDKAEAECVDMCVTAIVTGEKNWQARAWFLERRYNDDWGDKTKMKLEVAGEINVSMTTMAKAYEKWQKEKEKMPMASKLPSSLKD